MSKKSPLKQFQYITPTTEEMENIDIGFTPPTVDADFFSPDWHYSHTEIGKPPKFVDLTRDELKKVVTHMLHKGYTEKQIYAAINEKQQQLVNSYNSKIKAYKGRVEKYKESEKKWVDTAIEEMKKKPGFDKFLENEGNLETLKNQLIADREEGFIDEFGSFTKMYDFEFVIDADDPTSEGTKYLSDFSNLSAMNKLNLLENTSLDVRLVTTKEREATKSQFKEIKEVGHNIKTKHFRGNEKPTVKKLNNLIQDIDLNY